MYKVHAPLLFPRDVRFQLEGNHCRHLHSHMLLHHFALAEFARVLEMSVEQEHICKKSMVQTNYYYSLNYSNICNKTYIIPTKAIIVTQYILCAPIRD